MTGYLPKLLMLVLSGLKWGWSVLRHGHAKEQLTAHFRPMSSMKTNVQKSYFTISNSVSKNNSLARAKFDKQVKELIALWLINMQATDVWSSVGGLHLRANAVDSSHLRPYGILTCRNVCNRLDAHSLNSVKTVAFSVHLKKPMAEVYELRLEYWNSAFWKYIFLTSRKHTSSSPQESTWSKWRVCAFPESTSTAVRKEI